MRSPPMNLAIASFDPLEPDEFFAWRYNHSPSWAKIKITTNLLPIFLIFAIPQTFT